MAKITRSVEREFQDLDLGDERRENRAKVLLSAMFLAPEASIPVACGGKKETKAAYRFLSSSIPAASLRAAHGDAAAKRAEGKRRVLAVQDTTDLDFTCCPGIEGLGPLDSPLLRGLKVHTTMLLDQSGEPLGVLDQMVWARDPAELGKRHTRRKREPQEKESWRWREGFDAVQERLPETTEVIGIADRESDIYFVLAMPRRPGMELLIRSAYNRSVKSEYGHLRESVEAAPVIGTYRLALARTRKRRARTARLELRVARVMLAPPRNGTNGKCLEPVEVSAVWVREVGEVPKGEERVDWLLLATWPVQTLEQARACAEYYAHRWKVERYHYVLKSGCKIEDLQLETADRIERALALYSIVAWRILWLTYRARVAGSTPCGEALQDQEWRVLLAVSGIRKVREPSLEEAVRLIATFGGYQGRRSDGPPGVKSIWTGWRRLADFVLAAEALQQIPFVGNA